MCYLIQYNLILSCMVNIPLAGGRMSGMASRQDGSQFEDCLRRLNALEKKLTDQVKINRCVLNISYSSLIWLGCQPGFVIFFLVFWVSNGSSLWESENKGQKRPDSAWSAGQLRLQTKHLRQDCTQIVECWRYKCEECKEWNKKVLPDTFLH